MLGINFNVDINVKKVSSPFYFQHKNECTRCGAKGQLIFVDRFGRECSREVNALEHIKCRACGKVYSILWEPKENDSDKLYPSAVDTSVAIDFKNLVSHSSIKKNANNELC